MKYSKQLFRHLPEIGEIGDCYRTAIACLLDLEPEEVPHFVEQAWPSLDGYRDLAQKWLLRKGLREFSFPVATSSLSRVLECVSVWSPDCIYMLSGRSPRGTNHVVIAQHDKIIHDPAIDGGDLVGPCDDGLFWITVLVPTHIH